MEVVTIFQIKWLWNNLKGRKAFFVMAMVISAVTCSATLIIPKLSQIIVDDIIVGVKNNAGVIIHHTEKLVPLLIAIVATQAIAQSLRFLMVVLLEKTGQHMLINVKTKLYYNLQHLDMSYYGNMRTGDLMTRMTGDLDYVRHFTSWISYNIVDSVVLFIAALTFFYIQNVELALIITAVTPILFFITYYFSKIIRPVYANLREKLSQLNTCAQENIEGNRVVKAFNRQDYEGKKFAEKNEEFRKMNLKAVYTWQKFWPVIDFISQALTVITVLAGGLLIINGKLTFGQLSIFLLLNWAISFPMRNLGILLNDIQRFFASANKIIELYYAKPTVTDLPDSIDVDTAPSGSVTFDHVSLKFDNETVLDDISFDIKPGETIGIIGPTGSGKTTIANLIMRFYDTSSGSVKFDGIDVKKYKLSRLRSAIGVATQDVFLYSDTVDGNIAYNDPEMEEEKVFKYAKAADCDFINEMSDGYETIVGERGVGLSGGQRQRIALARALAKEPALLILDDTTSAVDMETEKVIQKNLRELASGCTKIIIAQRISSIREADKIFVIRNKQIEEAGTHSELIAKHGYYYRINKLQNEGLDPEEGENRAEK